MIFSNLYLFSKQIHMFYIYMTGITKHFMQVFAKIGTSHSVFYIETGIYILLRFYGDRDKPLSCLSIFHCFSLALPSYPEVILNQSIKHKLCLSSFTCGSFKIPTTLSVTDAHFLKLSCMVLSSFSYYACS